MIPRASHVPAARRKEEWGLNTANALFQKKLSPLNAWAFSFACMIGWAAFVMPGSMFLPQAGVLGTLLAFAAGTVAMIVVALNYHYLSNEHPQMGGLYPLVKASLNQHTAFAAGWALGLGHMCCVSLNARAMGRLVRAAFEDVFHYNFRVQFLDTGIQLMDVAIVVIAIVVFGFIIARGIKQTALIQTIGALMLMAGIVIMLVAAGITKDPTVNVVEPLFSPDVDPGFGFMAVFLLTPWAYVGFDSLVSVSQELKFPLKKLGKIMVISVLCGTFAYLANMFIALLGVTPWTGSWPEYLRSLQGRPGFQIYPVLMSARHAMGPAGTAVFLIACFSATLTGLVGFFTSISRMIYRMAADGALPSGLGKLHPRRGTPVNAVKTVVVVAFVLYLLLNAYNSIEELASTATAVGYGLCSFAAFRDAVQKKNRLYIATGAAGVVICLFFLFFLLVPIQGLSDSISQQGTFFIAVWIFLGIGVYAFAKRKKIEI